MNGPAPQSVVPALLIAIGLTAGGWLAGSGLARARMADRYVTVKGVAEREVRADIAVWPIRVRASDNDLARAQEKLASDLAKVRAFLREGGIDSGATVLGALSVTDAYSGLRGRDLVGSRFEIAQTMIVRSDKPDVVLAASQRIGQLLRQGVVLGSTEYQAAGPTFIYTKLNDIKPAMIADATARAREAADQFAHDSKSAIGGIRQAFQGEFEILARDEGEGVTESSQIAKRVRVVSTVDWYLKD